MPAVVESYFVNITENQVGPKPIGVLSALVAGFDRIAAKPLLILPSLLLDLILWLGPHLVVSSLLSTATAGLSVPAGADPAMAEQLALFRETLDLFGERYNLLTAFSTLPGGMPFNFLFALLTAVSVGIPSLAAGRMPVLTPLGPATQVDLANPLIITSVWLVLTLAGILAGTIFQRAIVRQIEPDVELGNLWRDWAKLIFLAAGGYLLTMIVLTAGVLITGIDGLAYIALPLLFVAGVYAAFTTHGIIRYRLGIWKAIKQSFQVVRFNFFSATGFLIAAFFIMWLTTTKIWSLAQEDSWIFTLAILGHAFITTMVIAGSYVFFQGRKDRLDWQLAQIIELLNQEKNGLADE
jgi:hypothetical protein